MRSGLLFAHMHISTELHMTCDYAKFGKKNVLIHWVFGIMYTTITITVCVFFLKVKASDPMVQEAAGSFPLLLISCNQMMINSSFYKLQLIHGFLK